MKIAIGETITRLRHEHKVTQEQLAQAIGISAPAVSKWERGQSYPDIALLPPLARFFDISVDRLLAYRPELDDDAREALFQEASAVFASQGWPEGLAHCEALLRAYPTDAKLRMLFAGNLMVNMVFAIGDEQRMEGKARQVAWLEDAVRLAQGATRLLAQYQLGISYLSQGQLDEAETTFGALKDMDFDTAMLMPTLRMRQGRYEEAMRLAQGNLLQYLNQLITTLGTMAALALKAEDTELARLYAQTGDRVLDVLDVSSEHSFRFLSAQALMQVAAATGDTQALLSACEAYTGSLLRLHDREDSPFFSLRPPAEKDAAASEQNRALLRIAAENFEESETFAALRGDPRFEAMLRRLKEA